MCKCSNHNDTNGGKAMIKTATLFIWDRKDYLARAIRLPLGLARLIVRLAPAGRTSWGE
ncbi:hypothetical protein SEA_ANDRIS_82 [Streptomyces phage Andris]|nr:hypothetical protein SEA_ANDRIS_82 [Streptomyces phage Andris]